ncbi:MAG TPA: hypothetical protein VFU31_29540 [Candidatus Binatia bacterium]|nr:hypothetical protein [Candidatus Binatia bacterium]
MTVSAEYDLILKNGRKITVQSYREESGMIRFQGLGGEIGISKDQIQTIRKAGENERPALDLSRPEALTPPRAPAGEEKKSAPQIAEQKKVDTPEKTAELRAKEEKEYQKKLAEMTGQLQAVRDRYAAETRGNTGSDPAFFTTEEAFRGHHEDLLSRLRDAQYKAQGLATGQASQSPPPALSAPPPYTDRQKELSDLRTQMNQLESERQRLIDEMKQKNFNTGSLFLE